MPSRYIVKDYAEESFYHVFNRGVEKRDIFIDDADYDYFFALLDSYLSPRKPTKQKDRRPNYYGRIELVAFCLMPNHFHLLIYQGQDKDALQEFMRSICTAYSMYFNKKYDRVGKLFQSRYKAIRVAQEDYFTHISRYIHLNPSDIGQDYLEYPYSSIHYWKGVVAPPWLDISRGISQFRSAGDYLGFLAEYESAKEELDEIKQALKE